MLTFRCLQHFIPPPPRVPPCKPFRYGPRPPTGSITFVRRFAPPFAELVRTGAKLQSVFAPRWSTPKPGDHLILQTWVGKSQRTLRRATVTSVTPIELPPGPDNPEIDDAFARAEGFNNLKHLLEAFKLPFRGVLIRWEPTPVTRSRGRPNFFQNSPV